MPLGLVRALATMLPRLEAEARLDAVQVSQLGAGLVDKDQARTVLQRWERMARPSTVARPTNWAAIGQMGLSLRRVVVTRDQPEAMVQ